jgi:SNF2 family DNA or RNA helicase
VRFKLVAKPRKTKQKPKWQKSTFGWNGSVFLSGDRLFLDFEYAVERVAVLKKLGDAKFHKETKSWSLPIKKLDLLRRTEFFQDLRYYFNASQIEMDEAERTHLVDEANKYVSLNPFIVPIEIFNPAIVEVELHYNPDRKLFIFRPKYKSKGEKNLKKFKGLLSSKREQGYLAQANSISEVISELRDSKISFAVTEEAGTILKGTAEKRAHVIKVGHGTSEELLSSFLTPFIERTEIEGEFGYQLSCWSPEHLQVLFPGIEAFPERKKKAAFLTEEELSEIIFRGSSVGLKVWLENAVINSVGDRLSSFEDKSNLVSAALVEKNEAFRTMRDFVLNDELLGGKGLSAKLFPHQRVGVEWLTQTDRALLGDDMGLGKTVTVLTTFERLRLAGEVDTLLVICPNSLKRNWIRESQNWFPESKLILLPETKPERFKFFRTVKFGARSCDGLVLNYEAVRRPTTVEQIVQFCEGRKILLCLDESQRVKNPRSKSFLAISEILPLVKRRVLLSGTPIPRDLSDIWSQVYLLDDGQRFGRNFFRWLTKVAELGNQYSEFAVRKFKPKEVTQIISQVRELLLRRRKEDVLSLPEKTFSTRDIELTGDQKKFYEEIRKELLLRVTSLSGATFLREIDNILEEYLRAVQVGSNPRLVDATWTGEPAKFLECDEIVKEVVEDGEGKLVIWTNYLLNVEELVKRYEKFGARAFSGEVSTEDRDKTVKEFQTGESVKILVAVPAAGGVGITLTASQTAVYLDKTWNAEHFLQSVDRIHRIGQTGTVNIISMHASKVDELISYNLRRKEKVMKELLGDSERRTVDLGLSREDLQRALE